MAASTSSSTTALPSGSDIAHAPQSTPSTDRFRSRIWLAGSCGIVPEANPTTMSRPWLPSERSAASLRSPPTVSIATSAPPSVISRTRALRSSVE